MNALQSMKTLAIVAVFAIAAWLLGIMPARAWQTGGGGISVGVSLGGGGSAGGSGSAGSSSQSRVENEDEGEGEAEGGEAAEGDEEDECSFCETGYEDCVNSADDDKEIHECGANEHHCFHDCDEQEKHEEHEEHER
jgi:hypothetical protein